MDLLCLVVIIVATTLLGSCVDINNIRSAHFQCVYITISYNNIALDSLSLFRFRL